MIINTNKPIKELVIFKFKKKSNIKLMLKTSNVLYMVEKHEIVFSNIEFLPTKFEIIGSQIETKFLFSLVEILINLRRCL
jgi:hypothetical protein